MKGFRAIGRLGSAVLIAAVALLLSPPSSSPIIAQEGAYPLIPQLAWVEGYDQVDDVAYGVAVDFQGNAVVVGTSGIIKYAPDGQRIWKFEEYDGVAYDVATDSLADVIVAGTGGLVKLSSDGRILWSVAGSFYGVAVAAGDRLVAVGPGGVGIYSPEGREVGRLTYEGKPHGVAASDGSVVVIGTGKIV